MTYRGDLIPPTFTPLFLSPSRRVDVDEDSFVVSSSWPCQQGERRVGRSRRPRSGLWSHSAGERFIYMVSSGLLVSSPCLFTDYLSQTRTRPYTRPVVSTRIVPLASLSVRPISRLPAATTSHPTTYLAIS
jgi:hypothetical protein